MMKELERYWCKVELLMTIVGVGLDQLTLDCWGTLIQAHISKLNLLGGFKLTGLAIKLTGLYKSRLSASGKGPPRVH